MAERNLLTGAQMKAAPAFFTRVYDFVSDIMPAKSRDGVQSKRKLKSFIKNTLRRRIKYGLKILPLHTSVSSVRLSTLLYGCLTPLKTKIALILPQAWRCWQVGSPRASPTLGQGSFPLEAALSLLLFSPINSMLQNISRTRLPTHNSKGQADLRTGICGKAGTGDLEIQER